MPIDPNIILGIKPVQIQQQDPLDQYGKSVALKNLMLQSDSAQRGIEDENAQRDALIASGGDNKRYRELLAGRGQHKAVQALDKFNLDSEEKRATIDKNKQEILIKATAAHRDQLANINDPQSAAQWVAAGYQDPVIGPVLSKALPLEQALGKIPQDPQAFQQWKEQAALGATKFIEHNQKAINDPFLAGPGGAPVANKPVQDFQLNKSKAGAPNVSVNTEKTFLGNLAEQVGKDVAAQNASAQGAIKTIQSANQIRDALASGKVQAGPGTTLKMAGSQLALAMGFKDDPEGLVQTRNAVQGLAKLSLDARAKLKGQGAISDFEGKTLLKAESGDIDSLSVPELKALADVADRGARQEISRNKANVERLGKNPNAKDVVGFMSVEEPPPYQPAVMQPPTNAPAGAAAVKIRGDDGYNALPSGALFIGPDGKTRRKP